MKPANATLNGVLLMASGAMIAPGIDVFAKLVPHEIPVAQVTAARFIMQSSLLLPIAAFLAVLHRPNKNEVLLHLLRATLIMVATGLFFSALRSMPIADAIAVFFVEPFILTLLGAVLLKETVGPRRIIACFIGFIGALFVIRPSFANTGAVTLLPLGTAACFAVYMILTRQMAQKMHPLAMQSYTAIAAVVLSAPVLWLADGSNIPGLDPVWPNAFAVQMMIGVGIMATLAHLLISFAMSKAPASTLAPLQYLEIVTATIFGITIFGDIPTSTTLLGVAIIISSGLYILARERQTSETSSGF
jgi:drug/metabolite transporter (DMT)-like permease